MLIGSTVDTVLNLITFAFVGACIWLLWRELPVRDHDVKHDRADSKQYNSPDE